MENKTIKINGDETLVAELEDEYTVKQWLLFKSLYIAWAVVFFSLISVIQHKQNWTVPLVTIAIIIFVYWFFLQPNQEVIKQNEEKQKHSEDVFEYFKTKYVLLKEFKNNEHINLGLITKEAETKDELMFDIFMEAHKKGADAIVLNSDTVSTEIYGSIKTSGSGRYAQVSGSTKSENTFHMTATLVKFK